MSEEAVKTAEETVETTENMEDVSYHAVEKDGSVTAIWEMQGAKHLRTIDPRSTEGKQILALFETAA
jgi:metal-dependent HD superfamily phosphatase/phosphodiesterase